MLPETNDLFSDISSSAIVSHDGLHRFRLNRLVDVYGSARFTFIGVNPSTADATKNDQTVKKWFGFVKTWGGYDFTVINLFTWRATNINELKTCHEVNRDFYSDHHLTSAINEADVVVACWGSSAKIPEQHRGRIPYVQRIVKDFRKPLKCFGYTKSGDVKHPLMLPYTTQLMDLT